MIKKILKKRWQRGIFYTITGIFLTLTLAIYFFAPYAVLKARRRSDGATPQVLGLAYQKLTIPAHNGVQLTGFYISAGDNAKGTVLLVHGIHAFKEYFLWSDLPKTLVENGFNVAAFDNRGHGESGDAYISYGQNEREDIKHLVSYIDSINNEKPLIIWGHSLGASIAINSLAVDKRIDMGILESGYYDLNEAVNLYQGHWFGLRWRWLSDWVLNQAATIGEFDVEGVQPYLAARKVNQPVWVGHGEQDNRIPVSHATVIYNELASGKKQLYKIPNARHVNVWKRAGDEYQRALLGFILNNIEQTTAAK